jgi:hypothetical protein
MEKKVGNVFRLLKRRAYAGLAAFADLLKEVETSDGLADEFCHKRDVRLYHLRVGRLVAASSA